MLATGFPARLCLCLPVSVCLRTCSVFLSIAVFIYPYLFQSVPVCSCLFQPLPVGFWFFMSVNFVYCPLISVSVWFLSVTACSCLFLYIPIHSCFNWLFLSVPVSLYLFICLCLFLSVPVCSCPNSLCRDGTAARTGNCLCFVSCICLPTSNAWAQKRLNLVKSPSSSWKYPSL